MNNSVECLDHFFMMIVQLFLGFLHAERVSVVRERFLRRDFRFVHCRWTFNKVIKKRARENRKIPVKRLTIWIRSSYNFLCFSWWGPLQRGISARARNLFGRLSWHLFIFLFLSPRRASIRRFIISVVNHIPVSLASAGRSLSLAAHECVALVWVFG